MENMRNSCRISYACDPDAQGTNLNSLPLSMAYVPWQRWQNLYKPEEGLSNGTIFQEVNLPFTGGGCRR